MRQRKKTTGSLCTVKVPRPCLRSLRFLRPKMRTLEKMSTRLPLHSPLFLLGLFLRRLVEGRSKCCSRACLFCLISPLAMAAAMAPNVTTARGPRVRKRSTDCTNSRLSRAFPARVTVPWWRLRGPFRDAKRPCVQTHISGSWLSFFFLFLLKYCVFPVRTLHDKCHIQTALIITGKKKKILAHDEGEEK